MPAPAFLLMSTAAYINGWLKGSIWQAFAMLHLSCFQTEKPRLCADYLMDSVPPALSSLSVELRHPSYETDMQVSLPEGGLFINHHSTKNYCPLARSPKVYTMFQYLLGEFLKRNHSISSVIIWSRIFFSPEDTYEILAQTSTALPRITQLTRASVCTCICAHFNCRIKSTADWKGIDLKGSMLSMVISFSPTFLKKQISLFHSTCPLAWEF